MSTNRKNILLTTLYLADEDILSKELILYLDKMSPLMSLLLPMA